ncbi:MAG: hypothetical protein WC213_11820 [Arenimonas sp.]|jgi:hypothetical protein
MRRMQKALREFAGIGTGRVYVRFNEAPFRSLPDASFGGIALVDQPDEFIDCLSLPPRRGRSPVNSILPTLALLAWLWPRIDPATHPPVSLARSAA